MTVNRGLWVPINTGNVGTTEVEARLADNALFESNDGVNARSGLLNPPSPTIVTGAANMSYNVAACDPVINRVAGEGVYRFSLTGTTNIATTAAPTANSRIDVIWVKQNDQSKSDANNLAILGVTQGVAAATPGAPAIPAGAMEIGRATVGPNITATTSASITQTFLYAALCGAATKVRNQAERDLITAPVPNQRVQRLDLPGTPEEFWNGSAWVSDGFSPVNTADANWTYQGGLWRDTRAGVTRTRLTLLMGRTGGSVALTTSAIAAFAALIPAGYRPKVGVEINTLISTSTGTVKWGLIVGVATDGGVTLRTNTGSASIATGDQVLMSYEWIS